MTYSEIEKDINPQKEVDEIKIEELFWDSNEFGYPISKIEIDTEDDKESISDAIRRAKDTDVKLLYIFADRDKRLHDQLEDKGALLVDEKTRYLRSLTPTKMHDANLVSKSMIGTPLDQRTLDLAYQAGAYSRFKMDPNLNKGEFEKLYKLWIERSLNGEIAFDVLGYQQGNELVGILTLGDKNGRADIGLVAVETRCRGIGIGRDLMLSAIYAASEKGFSEIQVVTQLANVAACNYYSKSGFVIEDIKNIYHLWF